jgi:cell division septum initiation protein DivIVA
MAATLSTQAALEQEVELLKATVQELSDAVASGQEALSELDEISALNEGLTTENNDLRARVAELEAAATAMNESESDPE